MSGALAFGGVGQEAKGYDVGLEFGSAGIGKDDIGSAAFTLKLPGLTLADLAGQDFGVRMTSVGVLGGDRGGSVKLTSAAFVAVDDANEAIQGGVREDSVVAGDVLQDVVATLGGGRMTETVSWASLDGGATKFALGQPHALGSTGATIVLNADGSYVIDAEGADALSAVQSVPFVVTYGVGQTYFDAAGRQIGQLAETSTLSFEIKGVNDAPVVSGVVAGAATEDGAVSSLDALANASDVDNGDRLAVVDLPADLPAGVTFDAATQTFALNPAHAAYQSLAQGQTTTVVVTYGVSDGLVSTPASVQWTVTGTNDAPVISGAVGGLATEDGPKVTLDALQNASDVDAGAKLSVVVDPAGLPPGVSYDAETHSFTLDPAHAAYQALNAGQSTVVTISYGVSDGIATTPATLQWTIAGGDEPVVKPPAAPTQDHFPLAPKDLSHVTFYFDLTAQDLTDQAFFFAKVETPGYVNDDLDVWYGQAVDQIVALNPLLAQARLVGAALKYGSAQSGGGEFYYALDGDLDQDPVPTGHLVQGSEYKLYAGGVTYGYDDLF
ncbi:cadherin-like domain-containing protein [Phenylobacterium sp. J426]|uniref:VCBS domain-containing protein n=1 Tax=Phenylobacterium sp. J426 TaxID=2898439 RepID=UPI00215193F2|nr:VCBS domain-containing protein [Phenylobacterium sp. J426]MCR5874107.1 cadherin-like domain-containing protein [Phenylobacterium sp. J426]